MALLTLAQVRENIESDLGDDAMNRLIDASDAEIIRKLGPLATQPETHEGGSRYIHLARAASAIVSVSERYNTLGAGYTTLNLSSNDYRLLPDGRKVERLSDGTNGADRFQGEVSIVTTPLDTTAERVNLLLKLVTLELNYTGHLIQSAGDHRVQPGPQAYADEKASLFRSLSTAGRRLIS